jgi:hypothetical protein
MATYHFITRWRLAAPVEQVWQALCDVARYGEWWPNIVAYRSLTPGNSGVGSVSERCVRGRLPYTLRYTTTVTHIDAPHTMAYDALGDLTGKGRFVLTPCDGGTEVTYHWDVATTGFWMNLLAPVLRWLFAWNHNQVMAAGERGLARWLSAHNGRAQSSGRTRDHA